jgi:hypothetical protein
VPWRWLSLALSLLGWMSYGASSVLALRDREQPWTNALLLSWAWLPAHYLAIAGVCTWQTAEPSDAIEVSH